MNGFENPNQDDIFEISKILQQQEKLAETMEGEVEIDDLVFQLQEGEILNFQNLLNKFCTLVNEDFEIMDYFSERISSQIQGLEPKHNKDKNFRSFC